MPVIGLVGAPPTPITYDAFDALAARATAYGRSLAAARQAAQFALLRGAGVVVGGGLFGFAIGQAIMDKVSQETQEIPVRQLYKVPGNQGNIRVLSTVTLQGVGELNFDNVFPSPVVMPVALPASGGTFRYGALVGPNATFVGFFQSAPDQQLSPFRVTSVNKENGDPANFQKVPAPAFPIVPYEPVKVPTTIPIIPGEPDFPITPTVYPAPENDPDKDDKQGEPGVIVKIPELGTQIKFSPTTVTIGRYKDPETATTEEPVPKFPPGTLPPASNVCPCPEDEDSSKEIICRLKALEKGLLSDGYDYKTTVGASGQGGVVSGIADELVYVELQIQSFAPYERTQRSAPGTPTVYFIGWFSWLIGNFPSERTPISYLNHNFIAPPNATGYLYSLHDGANATSKYITRTAKDYTDLC